MNGSNYLLKLAFLCRGKNYKKSFSTKSNRSKHENLKMMNHNLRKKLRSPESSFFIVVQQMAVMFSPNINVTLLKI